MESITVTKGTRERVEVRTQGTSMREGESNTHQVIGGELARGFFLLIICLGQGAKRGLLKERIAKRDNVLVNCVEWFV